MSEPTSTQIAARMGIVAAAATGLWDEAAEQIHALDAEQKDKFYGELDALMAVLKMVRREASHQ